MASKKIAGISALQSLQKQQDKRDKLSDIDINLIKTDPNQDRSLFDKDDIKKLSLSIDKFGLQEPIVVRPIDDGLLEIIAGERRYQACMLLKKETVQVIIKDVSEQDASTHQFLENLGKERLTALEIAEGLQKRMDQYSYSREQLAVMAGKSLSWVDKYMRLLKYPDGTKSLARDGVVNFHGTLVALKKLEVEDEESFLKVAERLRLDNGEPFSKIYNDVLGIEANRTESQPSPSGQTKNNKPGTDDSKMKVVKFQVSYSVLAHLFSRAERLSKENLYGEKDKDKLLKKLSLLEEKEADNENGQP